MNLQKASMAVPEFEIDKIVAAIGLNFDTSGTSFGGVSGYALPVVLYSTDAGATWQDAGFYSMPSGITLKPIYINAYVNSSGTVSLLKYGGSPATIYRFALLHLPNETTVTPPLVQADPSLYSSKFGYMKIAKQGSFQVSTAGIHTTTIAHNLGYVPFFQVFIKDATYTVGNQIRRINADFGNAGSPSEGVRVDTTNIYISTQNTIPTQTITVYYRIYYEN